MRHYSSSACARLCLPLLLALSSRLALGKVLVDLRVPSTTAAASFFTTTSTSTSSLFKQLITPANADVSSVLTLEQGPDANDALIGVQINNRSIFVPGGGAAQNGFRRTDLVAAMNNNVTEVGKTVFHQSIQASEALPLNLTHGYLLASVEIPTGDHVFDIFVGSDFSSNPSTPLPTANANQLRVRSLNTTTLFSVPFASQTIFNFAVEVDWTANTLAVFASTGNNDLQQVTQATSNDPKVLQFPQQGDYHLQLIKFPIADPAQNATQNSDVVHFGIQEGTTEQVFFTRSFVEDVNDGVTLRVTGAAASNATTRRARRF